MTGERARVSIVATALVAVIVTRLLMLVGAKRGRSGGAHSAASALRMAPSTATPETPRGTTDGSSHPSAATRDAAGAAGGEVVYASAAPSVHPFNIAAAALGGRGGSVTSERDAKRWIRTSLIDNGVSDVACSPAVRVGFRGSRVKWHSFWLPSLLAETLRRGSKMR
jgi:hypothetical protein